MRATWWFKRFQDLCSVISPSSCHVCQTYLGWGVLCSSCQPQRLQPAGRCARCFSPISRIEDGCTMCSTLSNVIGRWRYLWDYDDDSRAVIHAMKYGPSLPLARHLGEKFRLALPDLLNDSDPQWDYVVPMPASRNQIRRRGFNQSEVIAHALARSYGRNMIDVLRNRSPRPQAQQAATKRHRVFRYISVRPTAKLQNAKILLVDDVITTGASSTAAAALLRQAGAAQVDLFALARSPAWFRYQEKLSRKVLRLKG